MPDEYGDPTKNEINDWNIHNDHQDDNLDGNDPEPDDTEPETFRQARQGHSRGAVEAAHSRILEASGFLS